MRSQARTNEPPVHYSPIMNEVFERLKRLSVLSNIFEICFNIPQESCLLTLIIRKFYCALCCRYLCCRNLCCRQLCCRQLFCRKSFCRKLFCRKLFCRKLWSSQFQDTGAGILSYVSRRTFCSQKV